MRFARDPDVVGKVIDGEAIIINVATGMYYSADEVGGVIWTLLDSGHSVGEITTHVTRRYQVEADLARGDIERIVLRLLEEGLVQQADREAQPDAAAHESRRPYIAPSLDAYRDMKDLLALDPPIPFKRNPWERS
jgi:hypothetical protein